MFVTANHFKILLIESKQTLKLAVPIITSQVGQLLLGILDAIMLGRVGVVPLAAASFAGSLFSIFLVFGFGISSCISPLVARADGAQKKRESGEILRHGLVFVIYFGIILACMIELLSNYLKWFDQPAEVLQESKGYLLIMGWSIIPALLFQSLRQFCEGLSKAFIPMLIMLSAVLLNGGLNWLWIYGNWGFSAHGLMGAGWATFVTRVVMMIAIAIYIMRSPKYEENLPLRWFSKLKMTLIREMFALGFPSALQTLFEVGAFAAAAVMMGWISTSSLAAHQIAISIASMTFMVTLGISFASSIRVSNAIGRNDLRAARRCGFGGIGLGGIAMAFFGIVIFITHAWLPSIYIHDLDVIEIASKLLIIGAFFQIFDGIQGVAVGALRGMSDVRFPTLITFASYWVISMPLVYFLGFTYSYGAVGIWIGLSIGLIVASIALTWRFHILTNHRIQKSILAKEALASSASLAR
ncbi:MAG: efflux family protein [Bacteriovoracaceae bacterium]|nr:efflux family protein [Bacteriovoracaceae bacterium]